MINTLDRKWALAASSLMKKMLVVLLVFTMLFGTMSTAFASGTGTTLNTLTGYMVGAGIDRFESLPSWSQIMDHLQNKEQNHPDYIPATDADYAKKVNTWYAYKLIGDTFKNEGEFEEFKAAAAAKVSITPSGSTQAIGGDTATNAQKEQYNDVFSDFGSKVTTSQVFAMVDDLMNVGAFNPDSSVFSPVLKVFYSGVNIAFSLCSQLFMWGLLAQFGFDCLYIGVDFSRAFLTKYDESLEGEGIGKNITKQFKKGLPVISAEAYDIARGRGGSGSGNDAAVGNNKVLKYVKSRAGVVILGAVFLVMVSAGWWTTFISVVARLVINTLSYILNFFHLL